MFSLFYAPLFASAVLGASPFTHHNFHRHLAHEFEARDVASTNATNATVDMVAAAYFAGWHAANFTLDNVSWDKYTHMIYAFGVTDPATPNNVTLTSDDDDLLTQLVAKARNNTVKAMLSVGGWTGARAFSTNVGSSENRTAFVKTIVDLATKYDLDGVDFDWEYPNDAGIGCNALSPNDTSNFLTFLQELRADPTGEKLVLSAATPVSPWKDESGSPSANVSGFASVLDFITVMNYDVWGSWSDSVGPNSPLNDTCAATADQMGSAVSAVAAWTAAGMPAHQIVLGVASYGHSFTVTPDDALDCSSDDDVTLAAFPAFNKNSWPMGDGWDGPQGTDVCGNTDPNPSGNWDYWGLVQEGWLFENGTAQPGIDYRFDECSQTAYVYNETSQIMVSFDDPPAFKAKGEFIKSMGLRGFNMWEAGGDLHDTLLDAISVGAGIEDEDDSGDDSCDAEPSSSFPAGAAPTGNPAGGATSKAVTVGSAPTAPAAGSPAAGSPAAPTTHHATTKTPAVAAAPSPTSANNLANGKGDIGSSSVVVTKPTAVAASSSSSGGDDDCDDEEPSGTTSASAATATPTDDSGDGDDDDCDDDDDEETTTSSAPAATATPIDNSGSGDDDDCDDETSSAASVTPTITSSFVSVPASATGSASSVVSSSIASGVVSSSVVSASAVSSSVVASTDSAVTSSVVASTDSAVSSSVVASAVSSSVVSESSAAATESASASSAATTSAAASESAAVTSSAAASESTPASSSTTTSSADASPAASSPAVTSAAAVTEVVSSAAPAATSTLSDY